jgi:hypothetical protein
MTKRNILMHRSLTHLATVAAALPVLLVTGCGGDSGTTASSNTSASSSTATPSTASSAPADEMSSSASASPAPDKGLVVDVTVKDKNVTPNGERVDAKVGEPVTIHVTANRKGELHVHSTPEHELEYGVGKTTLKVTIDKPGIVDIEDHIAEKVVVQLEVS